MWFTSGNPTVLCSKPGALSPTDPLHHTSVAPTSASEDISCPAPGNLTGLPFVVPDAQKSSAAPVPTAVSNS